MDKHKHLVSYEVVNGIALITLTNAPANAYSYALMRQLDDWVLQARMDESVHVIMLIGQGDKFFCAGADIEMLQELTPTEKYYFCLHANETLSRLEQTPKLVIAALNGHTVGGGLEIAMAADLRIARAQAGKLGLPEVHLGVLPGTGGTQRLTRLLGKSQALELMVTGRNLSVAEAADIGLVHATFDAEDQNDFLQQAIEYADQFCPPHRAAGAVGLIKRACQSGSETSMDIGLALERELQQRLFTAQDAAEGLAAYREKRKPRFGGS